MKFINKLTDTASKTYKYTADKTNRITKLAKLKASMNEDKDKIEELYIKIGELIYENYIREEKNDITSELEDLCTEIDAHANQIEMARKEILKLKDLKQCKVCAYEMELDFEYCPKCGAKQKESIEKEVAINNEPNELNK